MRYSDSHKDETHKRLLAIAGRALRAKGPDGVAVADVMKEAGLTHGGFYAHFKNKDAMLAEALSGVFDHARVKFLAATDGMPPRAALAAYIDFYVSPRHRDNPSSGCPVTALNSDLPRQSKALRSAFDAGVKAMVLGLARRIGDAGIEGDADALAASVLSAMAGAVAISRAVSDKVLSDQMLATARESIKARLGVDDAGLSRSARQ
ncbi:MAG TPA: TetR/AcrR family transcriptional regulator [Rhizomicrobium sp.]|nr:TetR/AcrR family transcriptional regulator [Rhizomicrobium sp.]